MHFISTGIGLCQGRRFSRAWCTETHLLFALVQVSCVCVPTRKKERKNTRKTQSECVFSGGMFMLRLSPNMPFHHWVVRCIQEWECSKSGKKQNGECKSLQQFCFWGISLELWETACTSHENPCGKLDPWLALNMHTTVKKGTRHKKPSSKQQTTTRYCTTSSPLWTMMCFLSLV